jgi:(p)ppGpp synthase/HD superfamily hydrolase
MINYTDRLDKALRIAAKAHEDQGQHRKGSGIPYIIHPAGVMMIASNATEDEDTLIACLMHDVLEDVDSSIYSEADMTKDFSERVVAIVKDVTKNDDIADWKERSNAYLDHLQNKACDEAIIVSTSDKIHNLQSIIADYKEKGDELWSLFTTNSAEDQLWWYEYILEVVTKRQAPEGLVDRLNELVYQLKGLMNK